MLTTPAIDQQQQQPAISGQTGIYSAASFAVTPPSSSRSMIVNNTDNNNNNNNNNNKNLLTGPATCPPAASSSCTGAPLPDTPKKIPRQSNLFINNRGGGSEMAGKRTRLNAPSSAHQHHHTGCDLTAPTTSPTASPLRVIMSHAMTTGRGNLVTDDASDDDEPGQNRFSLCSEIDGPSSVVLSLTAPGRQQNYYQQAPPRLLSSSTTVDATNPGNSGNGGDCTPQVSPTQGQAVQQQNSQSGSASRIFSDERSRRQYLVRRAKNNEAARRSRDKKKQEEMLMRQLLNKCFTRLTQLRATAQFWADSYRELAKKTNAPPPLQDLRTIQHHEQVINNPVPDETPIDLADGGTLSSGEFVQQLKNTLPEYYKLLQELGYNISMDEIVPETPGSCNSMEQTSSGQRQHHTPISLLQQSSQQHIRHRSNSNSTQEAGYVEFCRSLANNAPFNTQQQPPQPISSPIIDAIGTSSNISRSDNNSGLVGGVDSNSSNNNNQRSAKTTINDNNGHLDLRRDRTLSDSGLGLNGSLMQQRLPQHIDGQETGLAGTTASDDDGDSERQTQQQQRQEIDQLRKSPTESDCMTPSITGLMPPSVAASLVAANNAASGSNENSLVAGSLFAAAAFDASTLDSRSPVITNITSAGNNNSENVVNNLIMSRQQQQQQQQQQQNYNRYYATQTPATFQHNQEMIANSYSAQMDQQLQNWHQQQQQQQQQQVTGYPHQTWSSATAPWFIAASSGNSDISPSIFAANGRLSAPVPRQFSASNYGGYFYADSSQSPANVFYNPYQMTTNNSRATTASFYQQQQQSNSNPQQSAYFNALTAANQTCPCAGSPMAVCEQHCQQANLSTTGSETGNGGGDEATYYNNRYAASSGIRGGCYRFSAAVTAQQTTSSDGVTPTRKRVASITISDEQELITGDKSTTNDNNNEAGDDDDGEDIMMEAAAGDGDDSSSASNPINRNNKEDDADGGGCDTLTSSELLSTFVASSFQQPPPAHANNNKQLQLPAVESIWRTRAMANHR